MAFSFSKLAISLSSFSNSRFSLNESFVLGSVLLLTGSFFIIGSDSAAKLYNVSIGAENIGNICHAISGIYNGGGGIAVHESARVDAVNCIFQDKLS